MYGLEEEEPSRVYECPKCKKKMGNDPQTIKAHNDRWCKPKKILKKKTTDAKKTTAKKRKKS